MSTQGEDVPRRPAVVLLVAAVIGILVVGAVVALAWLPSWEQRGQFGDMFGGVNALFSGLAFAGVIYALLLQRVELRLQREELAATRAELARTAVAQELMQAAMAKQAEQLRLSAKAQLLAAIVSAEASSQYARNHGISLLGAFSQGRIEALAREMSSMIDDLSGADKGP